MTEAHRTEIAPMTESDLNDIERNYKDFETFQNTVDGLHYARTSADDVPALVAEVRSLRAELASTLLALGNAHLATAKVEDQLAELRATK